MHNVKFIFIFHPKAFYNVYITSLKEKSYAAKSFTLILQESTTSFVDRAFPYDMFIAPRSEARKKEKCFAAKLSFTLCKTPRDVLLRTFFLYLS